MSVQSVVLMGRVCQEPVEREDADGERFVSFSVRVSGEPWLVKSYQNVDGLMRGLRTGDAVWVEGHEGMPGTTGVIAECVSTLRGVYDA